MITIKIRITTIPAKVSFRGNSKDCASPPIAKKKITKTIPIPIGKRIQAGILASTFSFPDALYIMNKIVPKISKVNKAITLQPKKFAKKEAKVVPAGVKIRM